MKQFPLVMSLSFLFPATVLALPILSASEDNHARLATITPDHTDPRLRYFFPNNGALQRNAQGVPRFGMSYWDAQSDGTKGGGYLSGVFNLSVGGELRESINEIRQQGYRISVLPVQRSFIRFMQDREGEQVFNNIFDEVSLPPYSGRAEDSIGLSATLTPIGGRVLSQQLLQTGFGSALEYCYTVKGVSPVFNAKISLNYNKVYRHFLAQARGGRWWWKWNVRTEVEKLVESGDIKIEINGGDAQKYDYIMALADRMATKFFEPVLENRRGSVPGRMGVSLTVIVEERDQSFELTQREIIERDYCVALGMDDIKEFPWLVVHIK